MGSSGVYKGLQDFRRVIEFLNARWDFTTTLALYEFWGSFNFILREVEVKPFLGG